MKKFVFRAIKISVLFILILSTFYIGQEYVFKRGDGNNTRVEGFYLEDKNSLDVVLLGSSDIFSGFSSSLAFEKYKFTSYPLCTDSNPVSLLKYELDDVLRYQNPKLIVIEVNSVLYADNTSLTDEAGLRRFTDSMPNSINRFDTINQNYREDLFSCYFPFVKYHGNWTDYHSCINNAKNMISMRNRGYSLLKGNFTYTKNKVSSDIINVSTEDSTLPLNDDLKESFIDFLEYCKEENIDNILFARFPHIISTKESYERFQRTNSFAELINGYGYDFLNLEKENSAVGLDFSKDFYNDDHLNIYGQKKFTEYFSKLLVEKYGITESELTVEQKNSWSQCVDYYHKFYSYVDNDIKKGKEEWISETDEFISKLKSY